MGVQLGVDLKLNEEPTMACPKCGCKVAYEVDPDDDGMAACDMTLERCAACGHVFELEDHTTEDDDECN